MITEKSKHPFYRPPFFFKVRSIKISGKPHFMAYGFWIYYCTLYIKSEYLRTEQIFLYPLFGNFYLYTKSKTIRGLFGKKKQEKSVLINKIYRQDLGLWEVKKWYGWQYRVFGQKPQNCILRK